MEYPSSDTLSEATAGGVETGAVTFGLCRDLVDTWQVVTEQEIKVDHKQSINKLNPFLFQWGMKYVWEEHGEVVEGAAGMCIAAADKMKDDIRDKNVCVLMCGGNIDIELHKSIVNN